MGKVQNEWYRKNRERVLAERKLKYHSDSEHRAKIAEGNKRRWAENSKLYSRFAKQTYLKKHYGLTLAQYDALHTAQDFKCAICKEKTELHVDHCHKTGKVRALLCGPCNRSLGMLRENPELCLAAATYLTRYK